MQTVNQVTILGHCATNQKGMIVFVQGELQYSKLEDGTYYTSIVCGRFDSRIELCEKKDSAGVKDDDAPPF